MTPAQLVAQLRRRAEATAEVENFDDDTATFDEWTMLLDAATAIEQLSSEAAARDADDLRRSEEGRTDYDYRRRIAALTERVDELELSIRLMEHDEQERDWIDG